MKYLKFLPVFILPVIFQACTASSYITDWRDPAFSGEIKKVLVVALMKDFEYEAYRKE